MLDKLIYNDIMRKIILMISGTLSLILAVIGIFLPLLPTTSSASCYFKSSKSLYNKLVGHKYLGSYIKYYYERKGVLRKTKIIVLYTIV